MTYKIRSHPGVDDDVSAIARYVGRWAEPETVEQRLLQIETTISQLRQFPHLGTVREEIAQGLRAIPTAELGVIAFVVDDVEQEVFVVTITYAGADWVTRSRNRLADGH